MDHKDIIEPIENCYRESSSDNTSISFLAIHQHIVDGDTETVQAVLSQLTYKKFLLNAKVLYTEKLVSVEVGIVFLSFVNPRVI